MEELKLHDIKPIVEIPDDSLYYFSATVIAVISVIALISWLVFRYVQRKRGINWHQLYLERLQKLEYDDAKAAAYAFTEYAWHLTLDEEQRQNRNTIIDALEPYKYKKAVAPIHDEVKQMMIDFIDGVAAKK